MGIPGNREIMKSECARNVNLPGLIKKEGKMSKNEREFCTIMNHRNADFIELFLRMSKTVRF